MTCEEMRALLLTGEPCLDHPHLEHCESCRSVSVALRDCWRELDAELNELGQARPFEEARNQVPISTRQRTGKMLEIGIYKGLVALAAAAALLLALPFGGQPNPESTSLTEVTQPDPISPDSAVLSKAKRITQETAAIEWNVLSDQDWGLKAHELHSLYQKLEPSIPGAQPDVLKAVLLLAAQTGRAAENANNERPPFYQEVGGKPVNYYWYIAGILATDELLNAIEDPDTRRVVNYYHSTAPKRCEPSPSNRAEVVLPSGATDGSWDKRVDLLVDGSLVAEDLRVSCVMPGEVRLEVPKENGEALQKRVWAATEIKVRKH